HLLRRWRPRGNALRAALRERQRLAETAEALRLAPRPVNAKRDALMTALTVVLARDREACSVKVGSGVRRLIPAQLPVGVYALWLRKAAIAYAEADLGLGR